MSQGIRTPGPITAFAALRDTAGNLSAGFYLGTCVTAPEPEGEKFKIPVMNDLGGRSVPFQLVKDGETWLIPLTMNRFDYTLCQQIRALDGGGAPVGSETGLARGTLVIGISDFVLCLVNQYAGTPSAGTFVGGLGNSDLIVSRTFATCNLRKYKESTVGTRVLEVAMMIEAQNVFDQTTRGFTLLTEGAPAIPLNPVT